MLEREQLDFLLAKAYNAAIIAGAKIIDIYTKYDDFYVSLKSDSTPITIADREAHSIIKHHLSVTRIPLLSEEGRDLYYDERRGWDLFWMVDPLDGTEEFIKRNGEFTVNIALMVNNQPLLGVIYVPTSETIYFSDPDRGSFCKTSVPAAMGSSFSINEIFIGAKRLPLRPTGNTPVKVAISRSHESSVMEEYLNYLKEKHGELFVMEYGSSLKLCLVAEGTADYYIRTTSTMEWDTAAGEAIARGAGVSMIALGDEQGEPLLYNKEQLINPPFVCYTKYIQP